MARQTDLAKGMSAMVQRQDDERWDTARRIIEILRVVGEADEPLGVSDICRKLALPKASVYRLVGSLENVGALVATETGSYKTFRLGPTMVELGERAKSQVKLIDLARPILQRLAKRSEEMVKLGVFHDGKVLIVDSVKDARGPALTADLGPTADLHCSALGKAMLSTVDEERLDEILQGLTWERRTANTVVTPKALKEEVRKIRENRLAYDREEYEEGLYCIGTPVEPGGGKPAVVLSVSGPVSRLQNKRERVEDALLEAAGALRSLMKRADDIRLPWDSGGFR